MTTKKHLSNPALSGIKKLKAKKPSGPPVAVPSHWFENSWDEKAKENPLLAVMGTVELLHADPNDFDEKQLAVLFEKGSRIFRTHIEPLIDQLQTNSRKLILVDYGCGIGRMLKPVSKNGHRIIGVDISPTMIRLARKLAPDTYRFETIRNGKCPVRSASADIVYSFATLKHIADMEAYWAAIDDMCRLVKKGGVLAINVNTQDYIDGDIENPGTTKNLKNGSEHFRLGQNKPYQKRKYTTWSGVYIDSSALQDRIQKNGLEVERIYFHTPKKLKGVWVIAKRPK